MPVGRRHAVRRIHTVHFFGGRSLAAQVAQLRHGRLHAVSRLVIAHCRIDVIVSADPVEKCTIQAIHKIQA